MFMGTVEFFRSSRGRLFSYYFGQFRVLIWVVLFSFCICFTRGVELGWGYLFYKRGNGLLRGLVLFKGGNQEAVVNLVFKLEFRYFFYDFSFQGVRCFIAAFRILLGYVIYYFSNQRVLEIIQEFIEIQYFYSEISRQFFCFLGRDVERSI